MRSRACRRRRSKKITAAAVITIVVIIISFVYIEKRVKEYTREMGTYYCRSQLSGLVNDAVCGVLERTGADYSDLSVDIYDESGKFVSSEICTKNVNLLQGMIISEINKNIRGICGENIKIPVGTLSGLSLLNGFGPEIKVRLIPVGNAETELKSSFESAGINQICHTISLDIKAEVRTVCPSGSEIAGVSMNCIIAENIISGEVPDGIIFSG